MEPIDRAVRKELIAVYTAYCKEGLSSAVRGMARGVYERYLGARTLLSEAANAALNRLVDVAYAYTDVKPLSQEEAARIAKQLSTSAMNHEHLEPA
jgi:hypothetical protein